MYIYLEMMPMDKLGKYNALEVKYKETIILTKGLFLCV